MVFGDFYLFSPTADDHVSFIYHHRHPRDIFVSKIFRNQTSTAGILTSRFDAEMPCLSTAAALTATAS